MTAASIPWPLLAGAAVAAVRRAWLTYGRRRTAAMAAARRRTARTQHRRRGPHRPHTHTIPGGTR